ncbi:hypothetical protein [Nocardia sp. NPDC002869]|uniref:hypothetical protein n=1 Tax=Nocardia sp. NPDC002869 TaxID=3161032 RepID=UPI00398D5CA3
MADAVDIAVTKYAITLHGIEIAVGGALARVEDRGPASSSRSAVPVPAHSPKPWIVIDRAGAADPGLLAVHSRATGSTLPARPMYATMMLEFGHVLDLLCGRRAQREAQRTLIAEYLRMSGTKGSNLGRVVDGYKRWRSQLGSSCFDHRMLSPDRALAAGFAAVELHGDKASGPAKALHRLLVAMAQLDRH